MEFPLLLVSALVSLLALLFTLIRFGHRRQFFWNTLLVSLTVYFLWAPRALYLFLSAFHPKDLSPTAVYVTSLPCACAPVVVMLIRFSYSRIRHSIRDSFVLGSYRRNTSLHQIVIPTDVENS